MLDDIVTVLVVEKLFVAFLDFVKNFCLSHFAAVFENPLQDSASVRMTRQCCSVDENVIDDEINLLREKLGSVRVAVARCFVGSVVQDFDAFLDNVISILIMDAAQHVVVKFSQESRKVVFVHCLQGFLDDTATVHLQRQLQHLALESFSDVGLHLGSTEIEQLLDNVVSKDIVPEAPNRRQDLLHDNLLLRDVAHFKPLLNEARAILVLAKLHDVSFNATHRPIASLCGSKLFQKRACHRGSLGVSTTSTRSAATPMAAAPSAALVVSSDTTTAVRAVQRIGSAKAVQHDGDSARSAHHSRRRDALLLRQTIRLPIRHLLAATLHWNDRDVLSSLIARHLLLHNLMVRRLLVLNRVSTTSTSTKPLLLRLLCRRCCAGIHVHGLTIRQHVCLQSLQTGLRLLEALTVLQTLKALLLLSSSIEYLLLLLLRLQLLLLHLLKLLGRVLQIHAALLLNVRTALAIAGASELLLLLLEKIQLVLLLLFHQRRRRLVREVATTAATATAQVLLLLVKLLLLMLVAVQLRLERRAAGLLLLWHVAALLELALK